MSNITKYLFPRSRYYGKFTPENLIFNANLQEFSHRVSIISSLETGGKISSREAYLQTDCRAMAAARKV
ncbi:hypothetical protein Pse7429DRAFT_3741 [Pseudanabaena biceps PCC 7429]|uniref:Uncharacterized protein n=1 Tax=Pseudanabaena biceps PCC 7429 TaxID=927668 RepID=L8MWD5_9CYAN|nr:hypothetical protein [Pseudanabaena biceps]ELS31139.1 hypothetical protein Pse7429DRAFT_3741 [Pseudanabaena biceps PCC 7429]